MKPFYVLVLSVYLPLAAGAQAVPADPVPAPLIAAEVDLKALEYLSRPVVVFADSPNDPNFIRQMNLLAEDPAALAARDVVVIQDTDPAAQSAIRQTLRPRGFSLVVLDKDLRTVIRKPLPWDVREITHAIDKLPLRRQEMLEQNPAGR